jgi:hypothetical protein
MLLTSYQQPKENELPKEEVQNLYNWIEKEVKNYYKQEFGK